MKRVWYLSFLVLVMAGSSLAPAPAQDAPDCAKCETKTRPHVVLANNPAACPGANRVQCQREYQKQYTAKCVAGFPVLRDCKAVVKKQAYPTVLFPAITCGTVRRDAKGNIVSVACDAPAGAAAGAPRNADFHTCTGTRWLIVAAPLPLDQRFALSFLQPEGPTVFTAVGTASLGRTLVEIPAGILELPNDELVVDGDLVRFRMTVDQLDNLMFTIPEQSFSPSSDDDSLLVDSAIVKNGALALDLAIRQPNFGAFDSYLLDLTGLQIQVISEAPSESAVPREGQLQPGEDDPLSLTLAATVHGIEGELTSGTGIIAKFSAAARPEPPEDGSKLRLWAFILGGALVLSWLFFLLRRGKQG